MKVNTQRTTLGRVRVVAGFILASLGLFIVSVVGSFYGYTNDVVWLSGVGLIVVGVLVAGSSELVAFLNGLR
jgi:hypothetical protein